MIYWTMTGTHVVPDRQQYIGLRQAHTLYRIDSSMTGTHQLHLAAADMIPGVSISYQNALSTSIRRLQAHPASALTIHPRKIQALWSNNHDTDSYGTLYQVDSSSSDVVIYWTMKGTHVVPDRQWYDGNTLAWLTYNCCTQSYTPPPVDLAPTTHLSLC